MPGRRVRELAARQTAEHPVGEPREHAADERSAEPPAAVRIARAADEIAALLHQRDHVVNGQHRPDFVGGEDQHVLAARRVRCRREAR